MELIEERRGEEKSRKRSTPRTATLHPVRYLRLCGDCTSNRWCESLTCCIPKRIYRDIREAV